MCIRDRIGGDLVVQLHYGRECSIEVETFLYIQRNLFNHLVGLYQEGSHLSGEFSVLRKRWCMAVLAPDLKPACLLVPARVHGIRNLPPYPAEEPIHALDTLVVPLYVTLTRPHEEYVAAQGVCAILSNVLIRIHHVAFGLGHLDALVVDHPLSEEIAKRFLKTDKIHVIQRFREESRVHEATARRLRPSDIRIPAEPLLHDSSIANHLAPPR